MNKPATQIAHKSFALLFLAFALSAPAFAGGGKQTEPKMKCNREYPIENSVLVDRTVDGDTVNVRANSGVYSIRMLGMDTPETHYMGKSQGRWGDTAADRLREMLPVGARITLQLSPTPCDKYGRVLAHVFIGKLHANLQMVKEGLAVNYCMAPSLAYCDEIGAAAAASIRARKGMFSDPNLELPYDFRHRISNREYTYYVGSWSTKEVFNPGPHQNEIPVADRIFFAAKENIKAPFELVDE